MRTLGVEGVAEPVGHGRRPPETRREYQARLGTDERLTGTAEVGLITESYNQARHAPFASSSPDVARVVSALARLRALWKDRSHSWRG